MTRARSITSVEIDTIRAWPTCKRSMDTATMRKRGSMATTSRAVCVPSITTLRSGVRGNHHAPFWNSGRRSDPPLDCNHPVQVAFALRADNGFMADLQPGTDRLKLVGGISSATVRDQIRRDPILSAGSIEHHQS